jgi:large subunit ribosomal protein L15
VKLSELKYNSGARRKKKRIGRGPGSGHGKTSCRGHKGQKARAGASIRPGFEGGQMPLIRRMPKRGFTSLFKRRYQEINVELLNRFDDGATVNAETLLAKEMVKKSGGAIKILGGGELSRKLTVVADAFSASAREKIEAAGGTAKTPENKKE